MITDTDRMEYIIKHSTFTPPNYGYHWGYHSFNIAAKYDPNKNMEVYTARDLREAIDNLIELGANEAPLVPKRSAE